MWKVELSGENLGGVHTGLFRDFFKGLADSLQATVHLSTPYTDGDHHAIEALFKAFGRAFWEAVQPVPGEAVMSTKGKIVD
jgi:imidazoleglycerol-phosphate dehydratase